MVLHCGIEREVVASASRAVALYECLSDPSGLRSCRPEKLLCRNGNHFAVALALANLCRVGDGTRCRAELRGVAAPSIPNLIVAGQAGDV